jgi:molybdenum cofactor synthesis domain-containing protein
VSTAAIVVIGNEILSAKIADENGPWLTRELRALGVEVRRIETIPDEIPLIVDALGRAKSQAKWVFTSGGIGPTHDDVTIAAVAQAFGRKVVSEPRILGMLEARYGDRMNAARKRLADVPEGADIDWHDGAYFPVIVLEDVAVLPGPPLLFKEGFGRIRERYRSAPLFSRAVYLALGEGDLAEHLDATVAEFPQVSIGSYPRFDVQADYRVKITFDGRVRDEVEAALAFFRRRVPEKCILRED